MSGVRDCTLIRSAASYEGTSKLPSDQTITASDDRARTELEWRNIDFVAALDRYFKNGSRA